MELDVTSIDECSRTRNWREVRHAVSYAQSLSVICYHTWFDKEWHHCGRNRRLFIATVAFRAPAESTQSTSDDGFNRNITSYPLNVIYGIRSETSTENHNSVDRKCKRPWKKIRSALAADETASTAREKVLMLRYNCLRTSRSAHLVYGPVPSVCYTNKTDRWVFVVCVARKLHDVIAIAGWGSVTVIVVRVRKRMGMGFRESSFESFMRWIPAMQKFGTSMVIFNVSFTENEQVYYCWSASPDFLR